MPVFLVYILKSETLNSFYVGMTSMVIEDRIRRHLSDHKGFTGKAKDWKLVYSEVFQTKEEDLKRESEIKNWKSSKRIQKLIFEHSSAGLEHPDL
jgi:putative endonuclease